MYSGSDNTVSPRCLTLHFISQVTLSGVNDAVHKSVCVCVCLLYNAVQIIALHINQEHEIIVSKNLSLEYGNIIRLRALDSIIYYPESERELSEQKKNKCCFKPVWAKPKLTTNSLTYFIPRGTDFSLFFFSYLLMRPKKKVALSAGGKKPAFEKQIGKKMNKKSWEQDAWQI